MDTPDQPVSTNSVAKGNLDLTQCQEQCDLDPDNCFAFQIDLAANTDSKCTLFNEPKDMVGDGESSAVCHLYRRTAEELALKEDEEKLIAVEKSTKVHHYMTSFVAQTGHI